MKKTYKSILVILAIAVIILSVVMNFSSTGRAEEATSNVNPEISDYVCTMSNADVELLAKYLILEAGGFDDSFEEMLYIGCVVLNHMESGHYESMEDFLEFNLPDEGIERMISFDKWPYSNKRMRNAYKVMDELILNNNRPLTDEYLFYSLKSEYGKFPLPDGFNEEIAAESEHFYFFRKNK